MPTTSPLTNKALSRAALLNSSLLPIAIFVIGGLLRFENVLFSFCIDDWDALKESLQVFPSALHQFRPVFFIGLHFWRILGPETDWWIKLLPFGFSLTAVILAWFVGKRFGGRPAAAALSLLVAFSPLHLDITNELRMYGLMSSLGLAQLLCYFRFRETGRTRFLVSTTVIGTVAMYTQPIYSFYLFGLFVFAFLDRRKISFWRYAAALAGIAVLYGPWVVITLSYGTTVLKASHALTTYALSAPFKLIAAYTTGFSYFKVHDLGLGAKFGIREVMNNLPLVLLAAAAFGTIVVGAVRQLRKPEERLALYSVIALAVVPFVLAYIGVLITNKDITHAQYHITSLPFVLILLVKGIQGLGKNKLTQGVVTALYAAVIGISLLHYFDTQHYGRRVDWHMAARLIEQQTSPSEPLVLLSEGELEQWVYPYLDRYASQTQAAWLGVTSPMKTISLEDYTEYLRKRLADYRTVSYLWDPAKKNILDPRNTVLKSLRSLGVDEKEVIIAPRLSIFRWSLPEATHLR